MDDTKTDPLRCQNHDLDVHDVRGPQLFKMLECDDPLAPSARFCLTDLDEVLLGRDPTRSYRRATLSGQRVLDCL